MRGVEQIPWVYDAMCWALEATGLRRWRQWLAGGAEGRVLEVGAGTGRNLPYYREGTSVVAVEPAPDTFARAGARAPGVARVRASAEALPFRDGAFDTVVSGLVFCSVPDPERGLREVRRVLKPGGWLRMIEHVRSASPLGARWQDFIQPAWTKVSGGCHPNRDTEGTLSRVGFTLTERRAKGNMRRLLLRREA